MYAHRVWNEHVREEDKCVVAKTVINSFKVKAELLDFINLQFMQFDL